MAFRSTSLFLASPAHPNIVLTLGSLHYPVWPVQSCQTKHSRNKLFFFPTQELVRASHYQLGRREIPFNTDRTFNNHLLYLPVLISHLRSPAPINFPHDPWVPASLFFVTHSHRLSHMHPVPLLMLVSISLVQFTALASASSRKPGREKIHDKCMLKKNKRITRPGQPFHWFFFFFSLDPNDSCRPLQVHLAV